MIWWLIFKIVGLIMLVAGVFLVVFYPGISKHQESGGGLTNFEMSGLVLGLILLVIGAFMLFSP